MLEMEIYSPRPEQKFPGIKWNNEQLKVEIAEAVKDYQNVVVTVETEKDSKALRAKLNKLRTAIETARKDMKAKVMLPLKEFEAQVKEVEEPIDRAIANLDAQLAEIKTLKQVQKRKQIEEQYASGKYPEWLTLEQIWDEKWLNATVTIDKIIEQMEEKVKHINANLLTIAELPEYAFEAEEIYKKTLDFGEAIRKAKEMGEIAKRKAAAEAAQRERETITDNPQNVEQNQKAADTVRIARIGVPQEEKKVEPKVYTFRFEVTLTAEQAAALGKYCKAQGITLMQIK